MTIQTKPAMPDAEGSATCDLITLQIVMGAIRATLREMEALIERTAMSPFIREKKDFNTGLFDARSRLIALSGMGGSTNIMTPILERFPLEEMRDGDIYWYNDCYGSKGAVSHTPDQVFVVPVMVDDRPVAFIQSWAHFNDIGGMRAGTLSPDCTEIFHEGTIVPPVRLARAGEMNDDLLRIFAANSRFPDMVRGDVRALVAATRLGKRRMGELFERHGVPRIENAFDQLISRTADEVVARARKKLPIGDYEFTEVLDSDGHGNGPFDIKFKLRVSANRIELDATESSDQTVGPFNYLMSPQGPAMALAGQLIGGDRNFLLNSGGAVVLDEAKLREGSILQPRFPAALGLRGVTAMRVNAAWMGIIAQATGGMVNASSSSYVVAYLRGKTDAGKFFLLSDPLGVGYGARTFADGNDGIYLVANENYPAEFVETSYPIRVRSYSLAQDSGGAGRWRGGCGIIRELEVLAPEAVFAIRMDSVAFPPWGIAGGKSGAKGTVTINPGTDTERDVDAVSDGTIVKRGDVVRITTGGGGGWGHPYDREPERVLADVLGGFVSRQVADDDYGVIFNADGETIDIDATEARRADRYETKLFHRGTYCETL